MSTLVSSEKDLSSLSGVFAGITAYLIWGVSPVYWNLIQMVPAFEIILHRIVWSFLFLLILMVISGQFREFLTILKRPVLLLILGLTAALVSTNWLIYIWSVNNGYIIQASLGYYINPLVNVLLGMIFLRERLRRLQILAVLLAAMGVLYLTVFYRTFPWISLSLAFSFGLYGLIRKSASVSSMGGLTVETMLLSIPASVMLVVLHGEGEGSLGKFGIKVTLLLLSTAVFTATPLILFNFAGKRLMLATLGFLQYLAPTCMLLIGVFLWGNGLATSQLVSFIFIWVALAIYSFDSVRAYRIFRRRTV